MPEFVTAALESAQAAAAAGVPFVGFGGIAGNYMIERLADVPTIMDGGC